MTKKINIILSLVNMSGKKQHYKPILTLEDVNEVFKNKTIDFHINEREYTLDYNTKKAEIVLKEKTPTENIITTFNRASSFEQILHVFGKL